MLLSPHCLFFSFPPFPPRRIIFYSDLMRLFPSQSHTKATALGSFHMQRYEGVDRKKKMGNFIPSYPDSFFSCQKAIGLLEMAFLRLEKKGRSCSQILAHPYLNNLGDSHGELKRGGGIKSNPIVRDDNAGRTIATKCVAYGERSDLSIL